MPQRPDEPQAGAAPSSTTGAVSIPRGRVVLSTSSVYPEPTATAFALASRLGYDGVEVMVWTDPVTQEAGALTALSRLHGIPIVSIHAPTLLLTQRIWGTDPWVKIDRSVEIAQDVGADTVVVHPPFRWQKDYARDFAVGVAAREALTGVRIAVENMFPWRARGRELLAYLPHWDPRDEHLVPGRGNQPCGEFLESLAEAGFDGDVAVEVATRRLSPDERERDLSESLAFARLHFAGKLVR